MLKFESTSALKFIASLTRDRGLAEVLALLAHAVRTIRLAPDDAEMREHLVDDLLQRIQRKLEGETTIQVHPFELYKDGLMVYEDHNRAESLALRLFRAGVASMTLSPEVEREALDTLVNALASPQPSPSGHDLMLLAWRDGLPGIGLEERPGFALEMLNSSNEAPSSAFYRGIGAALRFFSPQEERPASPSPQPETSWATLHQALHDAPTPALEPFDTKRAHDGLVTLAVGALERAPSNQEAMLERLTEALVLSGAQPALEALYTRLKATPRGEALIPSGASPQALGRVLRGLHRSMEARWVARFFATHTHSTPQEFAALFQENLTDQALRLLTHTLWLHPLARQDVWGQLLDTVSAGVALEVLRGLAEQPPSEAVLQVQLRACIHRDPVVRCQALHDVAEPENPRFQAALLLALKDSDSGVRMEALRRLHERRDPAVGILLVDRVRRPGFWLMSTAERRLLLGLLVELGGAQYSAFLIERLDQAETQLSRAEALGHNTAQEREAAEALLAAIALIPDGDLLSALQRRLVLGAPASLEEAYHRTQTALNDLLITPPRPTQTTPSRRNHRTAPDLPSPSPSSGPTQLDAPAFVSVQTPPSALPRPTPPRRTALGSAPQGPFIEDLLESYLREDNLTAPSGGSGLWSTLTAAPALMKELLAQDTPAEEPR